MTDVLPWISLVVSLLVGLLVSVISYTVRHRDAETDRRLAACEALTARVAAVEIRSAEHARDALHVQADIHAIKRDLAELLRLARGRESTHGPD